MIKLILSIALCQCAGILGSVFTRQSIPQWYAYINKPVFNPPDWIFAPVWILLYTLMGIALFLVWRKGLGVFETKQAFIIFIFQLALNVLWSIVFFGFRSIQGGAVVIIFLWLAIFLTFKKFYLISKPAGWLLAPYLFWVSFALVLNGAILILN